MTITTDNKEAVVLKSFARRMAVNLLSARTDMTNGMLYDDVVKGLKYAGLPKSDDSYVYSQQLARAEWTDISHEDISVLDCAQEVLSRSVKEFDESISRNAGCSVIVSKLGMPCRCSGLDRIIPS